MLKGSGYLYVRENRINCYCIRLVISLALALEFVLGSAMVNRHTPYRLTIIRSRGGFAIRVNGVDDECIITVVLFVCVYIFADKIKTRVG